MFIKKMSTLLVAATLAVNATGITALAAETETSSQPQAYVVPVTGEHEHVEGHRGQELPNTPVTRGANIPTKTYDLSSEGTYDFWFSAYGTSNTYSAVKVYGVSNSTIWIDADTESGDDSPYGVRVYSQGSDGTVKIGDFNFYTSTDQDYQISVPMVSDRYYYFNIIPGGVYISGDGTWSES